MPSVHKTVSRLTESRWSIIYVSLATLQAIIIVGIQAAIAYENTSESKRIMVSNVDQLLGDNGDAYERFDRMRWENIAFCGFQIWFCAMAYDSVINQNIAEVLAIFAMNFICAVLGSLEIMDNDRWINRLSPYINVALLKTAGKIEIVLAVLLPVFAIAFALPSYKLTKQLGWTRYKKIGADLAIDKMYRVYQQFLLVVKIDIFTEFLVSLFFVIKGGILTNGTNVSLTWIELVQIAVTALILPMLIAGRYSAKNESNTGMVIFITFQIIVLFHFALMLYLTVGVADKWIIWLCFVVIGFIITFTTVVLAIMCQRNFGKGLKAVVQKKPKNETDAVKELHALEAQDSWKIDD
ncbi:hypothetical protein BGW37DRAFT_124133 [Umbelopsis sp. PMI_123]|nr:hypothetical protein BGW37DRAFT_124133 [Umbelopsis sp. PMI_123]